MKRISTTALRLHNKASLKALLESELVVDQKNEPLVVIVPYQKYMEMQEQLIDAIRFLEGSGELCQK